MKTENFSDYLVKLQPELFYFALKLTADRDDAKDLLQATSLKALDSDFKFVPESNFKGWLYIVMRNIFVNNYRKVVREQSYVKTSDDFYISNASPEHADESFESSCDIREMYKIVNSLPKDFKVPFAMYVSGFKYREISEKLNMPIGTVKSKIFLTRQKLQIIFRDFR